MIRSVLSRFLVMMWPNSSESVDSWLAPCRFVCDVVVGRIWDCLVVLGRRVQVFLEGLVVELSVLLFACIVLDVFVGPDAHRRRHAATVADQGVGLLILGRHQHGLCWGRRFVYAS